MSKEMQTTATLNSDRNSNTTAETPETENEKEESKNPTGLWTDLFKFKTSKTANSVWFGALWSGWVEALVVQYLRHKSGFRDFLSLFVFMKRASALM